MENMFRGLALSIVLYLVVTAVVVGVVRLCGGEFTQIPGVLFLVIGACTGIGASIINDKLD